ncbi:PstS family phosphate ABC transporter substrate-binding protein [Cytobacillus massiliigabonensis]|uniref:PstS family phosphate ABC transporter substrate-binding protein n=1 Tax=Cytobacillus massiliigabonensis TaxID=1871011 RepID=UPI000C831AA8|nr:substrate-binding domain-containing protein [Cytobacillus massiliigabonensis]
MKNAWLLLMYFGFIPFGLSFLTFAFMSIGLNEVIIASILPLVIGGGVGGYKVAVKKKQNVLFCIPIAYTAILWAIFMVISSGFYGADEWFIFALSHIAYAPIYFMASLLGVGGLFIWAPLAYELSFLFGILLAIVLRKERPVFKMKQLLVITVILLLGFGTGAAIQWKRSQTVLPSYGFDHGGGYSSTDLTPYEVTNPHNILPKLDSPSAFTIKNQKDMPVLDGAEAAFPVYSAFANAAYENISKGNLSGEKITFTNTIYAYERLLSKDVDIYFGAEPSAEQQKMAERAGKELVLTPIGKEAFVFFVNPDNKIANLTVNEIQGIYSGKIKNWSEMKGKNERIIAFQRPENSGSQTLLEKIMGDTEIMKPLKEEVPAGMGGIMEQVADYRNYKNAIGFSFRFFATGMNPNPDIKLLSIDGIEPSPENISNGSYPFTASLYAITLKDNPNPMIKPFLEWMTGPEGQRIVEEIGYIKLQ